MPSSKSIPDQRAEKMKAMALHLLHSQRIERRQLAHQIHDTLQQTLSLASMHASQLSRKASEDQKQDFAQIKDLMFEAISLSRKISQQLCPPVLDDFGLPAALQWLGRWFLENYDYMVELSVEPPELVRNSGGLDETCAWLAFEFTKRALLNACQENPQQPASLKLTLNANVLEIEIRAAENAKEPDPDLQMILEFLQTVNGASAIEPMAGGGVRLRLRTSHAADPD